LYRFNAVQDWLREKRWTVESMLRHVREIERAFLSASRSADVNTATLIVSDERRRGRFLTFRTAEASVIVEQLAAKNIIVDHRGDRLRIGFGIYHNKSDALRLAEALS
jgi:selenocysteine lyase/cysteine desulfurase